MNTLRRRRFVNVVAFCASIMATLIGLTMLALILWTLISRGLAGMSPALFTQMTPARDQGRTTSQTTFHCVAPTP